ncbi:MAG TPA: SpoIIE family protein phosphatase, partial [Pyrinomonadaceae bacterium]|nr:SpoIIE family protein phosphatase [Pyrinomonadaceae bacterium]
LLVVPVSRALVHQYREITGIYIRPFFLITRTDPGNAQVNISIGEDTQGRVSLTRRQRGQVVEVEQRVAEIFNADQLGESLGKGTKYPVVLPTTNWFSGESTQNLSFLFDWSWTLASKQLLEGSRPGEVWRQALKFVGITFLALELLALFAAALMTRAVTGTVHRLYHATQLIKRGDFSHRIRVRSHDQLGELAVAFNEMSANIESLMHERVERERLQREVEIAAEVQAQLFPSRVPDLSTVEIAAECRAARGVAGDYYDYVEVASGIVALALGDVSGKGVSASLVMSNLQATLRAQTTITAERLSIAERAVAVSAGAARGTAQLLARVVADADMDGAVSRMTKNINEQLCRSTDADRFATLFLALYEDRTRTLRYTNAGHNAPILVRASGALERLTVGGVIVGAFDWAPYQEASTTLQADDLLVIYSDGISEAAGATGEEYGEERLARFVVEHRTLSADELRRALFDEINAWSGNQERDDDQTLVIVKARKR